jgi:hypothetical protein
MLFAVFLMECPSFMILVAAVEVVPRYVLCLVLGLPLRSPGGCSHKVEGTAD